MQRSKDEQQTVIKSMEIAFQAEKHAYGMERKGRSTRQRSEREAEANKHIGA